MAKRDKLYAHRGADTVAGNYEADYSAGSRALRLTSAKRGRWIGGRGRVIGSELNNLEKMDDETIAEAPGMIETALAPLTEIGEISDIEITSAPVGAREGTLGNYVEYNDNTSHDGGKHELSGGWKE